MDLETWPLAWKVPKDTVPAILKMSQPSLHFFSEELFRLCWIFSHHTIQRIHIHQLNKDIGSLNIKSLIYIRREIYFYTSKRLGRSLDFGFLVFCVFFLRLVTISLGSDRLPSGLLLKSLWDTQYLWFTTKKGSFCHYIKGSSNKKASYLSQRNIGTMN